MSAPATRTYTEAIAAALLCFSASSNEVAISARSRAGFGDKQFWLHRNQLQSHGAPIPLLELLADDWELRVAPFASSPGSGRPLEWPLLFCHWTPARKFGRPPTDPTAQHRHYIEPAARVAIDAALREVPAPPSLLIDGAHEVWAAWRLAQPLTDGRKALRLMQSLAERLNGIAVATDDVGSLTLPLAGVVRNWNQYPASAIQIAVADPTHRYRNEDIDAR